MIKIMFVCHGNICRSPMAEFIFKDMLKKCGREKEFVVASSATSTEEIWNGIGNSVYPPAKEELAKHDIFCKGKRAVQLKNQIMINMICFFAWTAEMSQIPYGFSAEIPIIKYASCLKIKTFQTLGTRIDLMLPIMIFMMDAVSFWRIYDADMESVARLP